MPALNYHFALIVSKDWINELLPIPFKPINKFRDFVSHEISLKDLKFFIVTFFYHINEFINDLILLKRSITSGLPPVPEVIDLINLVSERIISANEFIKSSS